jgi:hypothetical protein
MVLNRKSAKQTSRISLFVALTMIAILTGVLHSQGYQVEYMTENGVQLCKAGFVELFSSLLW